MTSHTGNTVTETVSARDREVLRRLACDVAEAAARDCEREKRSLWYTLNALEDVRPLVFCSPENGWNEIILPGDLECEGELARSMEFGLRAEVFWARRMNDDRVTTGTWDVGYTVDEGDYGVECRRIGGGNGGAYTWDPPIKSEADLERLRIPRVKVDHDATQRSLDLAHSLFDGILEVRLRHTWFWSVGLTWPLVRLRGLEQMMLDMVEQPEMVHALMSFLRDAHLAKMEQLEAEGLLHLNNEGQYVGSGGFGWPRELPAPGFTGHVRIRDLWGLAESQETVGCSPAMFEEFIFPYQQPLIERFGLACYGCCEPVHSRWHIISRLPNLRRVSVSPWCDVADIAAKMQDRYILSLKPNPSHLATDSFDEDVVRRELRTKLEQARGCRVEVIMKDNHTIGRDPDRVVRWVQIAREECERAYERWRV